jgi:hypothetical protein
MNDTNDSKNPLTSGRILNFLHTKGLTFIACNHSDDSLHHNEHNQSLRLKACSFKSQGVLCLSIFFLVFSYSAVPEVFPGKPD